MFIGRAAELALLRAELRAAAGGRVRTVVIEGPEGIGKTALVHRLLSTEAPGPRDGQPGDPPAEGRDRPPVGDTGGAAIGPPVGVASRAPIGTPVGAVSETPVGTASGTPGIRVLSASGERGERDLSLGVIRQLAAEARHRLLPDAALPDAALPNAALSDTAGSDTAGSDTAGSDTAGSDTAGSDTAGSDVAALAALAAGPVGGRFAASWVAMAGGVIGEVISQVQVGGPVVIVVDDAQWADQASLHALTCLLRHLRAGRVLVLFVCRDLAGAWLPDGLRRLLTADGVLHLALTGLGAADLDELSAVLLPPPPPARLAGARHPAWPSLPAPAWDGSPAPVWDGSPAPIWGGAPVTGPGHPVWGGAFPSAPATDGGPLDGGSWGGAFPSAPAASGGPSGGGLGEEAAERLRDHTLGNPLHARALLAALPLPVLRDLTVRLPAPATYTRPFTRRLDGCAPAARRLVAACAVLGDGCPLHVAATVAGGLDDPLSTLEEAAAAGLLRELPGRLVAFPDPLARAAAYDGLGAGTRARLHLTAAAASGDTGTALRHRAAAAGGPDDLLAEELAGYAAKAAQHGQWQEAAAHLELAAGLTDAVLAPARREGLRTAVLEHVLIGGDAVRATRLAAALARETSGHLAARGAGPDPARQYVLGRLALVTGRFDEAAELLAEAWRHRAWQHRSWQHRAPGLAADVAEQLAWLHLLTGDRDSAATWARQAIDQPIEGAVARPHDVLALAAGTRGHGRAASGDGFAAALDWLERDEPERACEVLRHAVTRAGQAGLAHHRLLATGLLAAAEHAAARWDDAAARAERALCEAAALGQRWLLPVLGAACVAPLAARGRHERALAHATAALDAARRTRHALGERQAALALALLGAGDLPPGHLPPGDLPPGDLPPGDLPPGDLPPGDPATGGARDPFVADPRPRRVEALVAAGRLPEAEHVLNALGDGPGRDGDRSRPSAGSPPGARRRAERIRLAGLLLAARNVPEEAERSFAAALTLVEHGVCPLEEARVLLDLGRLLRRTGRRKAAAERLAAARAAFERLGARPLVERCARELEACGLEPQAPARLGLTPQELSTAALVAHGLTNRQIATELLISVKTVEYHIGKIYTKLGIGSRVALAAKFASGESEGPA
ncbi:AAA family ATPase [Nonomuraea sp. NPDC050783]|uniref:helix-turn-helix transcriptional regulator n=1 Tax=Nonomuraea sp. NPDC050783 TaxID=3154634 RepID=UPI003467D80D